MSLNLRHLFKLLSVTALLISGVSELYGADGEKIATPFAYNPGAFCEQGAEKLMAPLVEANKEQFENIENLREKIDKLKKRNALLCEVKAMRDNYEKSIAELARAPKAKTLALDPLKSTIRNGLMMSAISTLLSKDQLESDTPLTMSSLCQSHEDQKICDKESGTKNYKHKLEPFLAAFKKSFIKSGEKKDQAALKVDLENIINSIPKELSPEVILSLIDAKAPELSKILSQDLPRQKVLDCLSGGKNFEFACNGIIKNPKEKLALEKVVALENSSLQESLKSGFSPVFGEMIKRQQREMEAAFSFSSGAYDPKDRFKKLAASVLEKAPEIGRKMKPADSGSTSKKPAFNDDAIFFYIPPKLEGTIDDAREKLELQAITKANSQSEAFHKDCNFEKVQFNTSTEEDSAIDKCRVHLDQLKRGFELRDSEFGLKLEALDSEMKRLSTNDSFIQTEKLKKYLAEKYICECSTKTGKITKSNDNLELDITTCGQKTYKQNMTITKLDNLTKNLSSILKVNFASDINTDINQCGTALRASNLEQYAKNCQGENAAKFKDLCTILDTQARKERVVAEDEKKWDKRYQENWVDYDDSGKMKLTPKKSTGRLIAEGALPVLAPKIIPMLFTQFASTQNIQSLMNQAILNKQLLHNATVYDQNPWMYNYSAFGTSPLVMNWQTGVITSSQSALTTGGFNFGLGK